jgi:prepilin-type N-terminal cleavage/methylation domain-containing protein
MRHTLRPAAGFTLIEMLVVIAIIALLGALVLYGLGIALSTAGSGKSKTMMAAICLALESYRNDFDEYPPHNAPMGTHGLPSGDQAGSEILSYYLLTKFKGGEQTNGTYLERHQATGLTETGGTPVRELRTPNGDFYRYTRLAEPVPGSGGKTVRYRNYLLADPGPDRRWGGTLDEERGWVSSGEDANHDGKPDDADNVFSSPVVLKTAAEQKN